MQAAIVQAAIANQSPRVPVQRLSDAWVVFAEFALGKAPVPVAFRAASDGNKVGWIIAPTCNPAAWDTTLVTQ